jgi:hypothetical protein
VINSLTPSKTTAGYPAFLLGTSGSGWAPCTVIQWNGESRTTLFVGATGATAPISAGDIAVAGQAAVTAVNPTATGGTSSTVSFPIFSAPGQSSGSASAAGALATPYQSTDGRYVVFVLASTDGKTEVPGSTENVFLQDTCTGVASGCTPSITLVSAGAGCNTATANCSSFSPSISADGRYVAFLSYNTYLIANDTNTQGYADIFLWDSCTGVTTGCTPSMQIISTASGTNGPQANGGSTSAAVNSDGRFVTFRSTATNLDLSSTATTGLFLRDTCNGVSGCTPSTAELQ